MLLAQHGGTSVARPGSLRNAFEAIDLDESGAISFEEFKKCGWTLRSLVEGMENHRKTHRQLGK